MKSYTLQSTGEIVHQVQSDTLQPGYKLVVKPYHTFDGKRRGHLLTVRDNNLKAA